MGESQRALSLSSSLVRWFATVLALTSFLLFPALGEAASTKVIAVSGDPSPDGSGGLVIRGGSPGPRAVLNDAGHVAFAADTDSNVGDGIARTDGLYRGDGQTLVQIAGGLNPLLNQYGTYVNPSDFVLNDAGQVAFGGFVVSGFAGPMLSSQLLGDGGSVTEIARTSPPAVHGDTMFFVMANRPALNDAGETAFWAALNGPLSGSGIFRADGSTTVTIAQTHQPAPDGNGTFDSFGKSVALNDAGSTAFLARLSNTSGGISDYAGIFRGNGSTTVQIARKGQTVPDGNGYYSEFVAPPSLNDANQVAFRASLRGVSDYDEGGGIFRGDGALITQIARDHQAAPDGDGFFSDLGSNVYGWSDGPETPPLNNEGQVLFLTRLTDTIGGDTDDVGLFRGDGTSLVQIARKGQTFPGGNGIIESISSPALNDAGQVAFVANLVNTSGGSTDNQAIYFFDDTEGLKTIARLGDRFLGSTIEKLAFESAGYGAYEEDGYRGDEGNGFNEKGPARIAYGFKLADGRGGVALWSLVPEPDSIVLATLATLGCAAIGPRRRRRPFDGR